MHASAAATETEQVTLTLPRTVVRSAEQIAARTPRPVETVLAGWLEHAAAESPVEALDDASVVSLCELRLSAVEQAELDGLLVDNREGRLDETRMDRLGAVMEEYDRLLLRKSQALREAVARGLREPLAGPALPRPPKVSPMGWLADEPELAGQLEEAATP